jgi:hypothetical protein
MPPVGFEPTISEGKRAQNYALDRAASGIGAIIINPFKSEIKLKFIPMPLKFVIVIFATWGRAVA